MQVKATLATEQSDSKEGSKIVNTTLPEDTTAKALSSSDANTTDKGTN